MDLPLPPARLLRAWTRAFTRRRDVLVIDDAFAHGIEDGSALADLPPDAASFAREHRAVEFTWVLAEHAEERKSYSKGYRGGRLNLMLDTVWSPREGWERAEFDEYATLDHVVEEASTWFVTRNGAPRSRSALLFYPSPGPEGIRVFRTFEEYLTEGARRAFVWYWQMRGYWEADAFVKCLRDGSISETTPPAQIARALEGRGIEAEDANALVVWLGADATLLVDAA